MKCGLFYVSHFLNEIKGAIEAVVKTFAVEAAAKGITVNAINPRPTDTGWMNEEIKQQLLPKFPFGRIGIPHDAARLIRFLASEEAAWITGQVRWVYTIRN
ncbi:enoyl-ACP reductase-like protein [Anoxybacillus vitaminiphilus]|uniref:Enoyl-ACP reductase-like protein n=1 Tax=Paranoxybacillus vitaminiphilus TaxID=581036 RepID=A0A327YP47_9BACL|nr:enoyl-ACP reductase-like protein [Anoxybacillus vitaminiphilus]